MTVANNSLVTLSVVLQRVSVVSGSLFPLVCEGITGGQWYQLQPLLEGWVNEMCHEE